MSKGDMGVFFQTITNMDINLALNHNIGAHGTTAVVQIYERR